jgi:hypothetical protein
VLSCYICLEAILKPKEVIFPEAANNIKIDKNKKLGRPTNTKYEKRQSNRLRSINN